MKSPALSLASEFNRSRTVTGSQILVSQNVIPGPAKPGGNRPTDFTEQGVAMLPNIFRGDRTVEFTVTMP